MNAAARIFLHIRSLRRGVCVLNCCNNSLFMLRQSAFGHEGLSHLTRNMLWCMIYYTCGGEGVNFGGSWVASYSSPLPRRGRGAATDLHVFHVVAFCLLVVRLTACSLEVTLPKLRNSHAEKRFAFAHLAGPLHVLTGSSFVLLCYPTDPRLTDGPFGPQRYYLHLLLRRLVPRGIPRV